MLGCGYFDACAAFFQLDLIVARAGYLALLIVLVGGQAGAYFTYIWHDGYIAQIGASSPVHMGLGKRIYCVVLILVSRAIVPMPSLFRRIWPWLDSPERNAWAWECVSDVGRAYKGIYILGQVFALTARRISIPRSASAERRGACVKQNAVETVDIHLDLYFSFFCLGRKGAYNEVNHRGRQYRERPVLRRQRL